MLSEFLLWDKILIVCYIIFSVFVTIGILYLNIPSIKKFIEDVLLTFAVKVEEFNHRMNDDDVFDNNWMDYDSWVQTRINNRKGKT